MDRGSRCASTPGYLLSSLRDESRQGPCAPCQDGAFLLQAGSLPVPVSQRIIFPGTHFLDGNYSAPVRVACPKPAEAGAPERRLQPALRPRSPRSLRPRAGAGMFRIRCH